ncbi:MAG: hypothetical protein CMN75_15740 [Spirochaeta sp.]|nr:hypothetical protein [Spirochaeta sp.]RPG10545.1 MAG: sigma-54-dependent Fis family transcriptional regulator [Proteobacteria bacterium TMED72]
MNILSPIQQILIVESDSAESEGIRPLLDTLRIRCRSAKTAVEAIKALQDHHFDVILSCPDAPDTEALPLLAQLAHMAPNTPILLLKKAGERTDTPTSVNIWETLDCPIVVERLEGALARVAVTLAAKQQITTLQEQLSNALAPPPIVGSSEEMVALLEGIEDAAFSDQPTLLFGEAGSHRESIARALHDLSAQRAGPFTTLAYESSQTHPPLSKQENRSFLESFLQATQTAAGGTLFLSNIERLSLEEQSEIFQFLERKELQDPSCTSEAPLPRLVASTNLDLHHEVQAASFLKELNDRFELNRLTIPPLRERREDIAILADHWSRVFSQTHGRVVWGINEQAMAHLVSHSWPGNLRELEAVIRVAVSRCNSDHIAPTDLPLDLFDCPGSEDPSQTDSKRFDLKSSRQRAETQTIRRALEQTNENRTHAAKLLNISHRALLYKIKAYGI